MCLRPPSLTKQSFLDGFRVARLFRGFGGPGADRSRLLASAPPVIVVAYLEPLLERRPRDWLLRYILADFCIRDHQYRMALDVLLEAKELRPRDPRTTFALATAYRALSEAHYVDGGPFQASHVFKPEVSARELARIGMTAEQAAEKSIECFEETLVLGVRSGEFAMVNQSLQAMYVQFPQMEEKLEHLRRSGRGPWGISRRGASGTYSEAVAHYTRVRFQLGGPEADWEMAEVVRLCQEAIAANDRLGDAYVLLANAYLFLHSSLERPRDRSGGSTSMLLNAACILHHWATEPLSKYPFSKEQQNGAKLYSDALHALARLMGTPVEGVRDYVAQATPTTLPVALAKTAFEPVRQRILANLSEQRQAGRSSARR